MPIEEKVLLVCIPGNGAPVLTSDATLDLATGQLARITHPQLLQVAAAPTLEWFIRLKGHPARFPVACRAAPRGPLLHVEATPLAQVHAALAERGAHPCAARQQG